jgi:hypothetical protein
MCGGICNYTGKSVQVILETDKTNSIVYVYALSSHHQAPAPDMKSLALSSANTRRSCCVSHRGSQRYPKKTTLIGGKTAFCFKKLQNLFVRKAYY